MQSAGVYWKPVINILDDGASRLRAPVFTTVMGRPGQVGYPKGSIWVGTGDSGLLRLAGRWLPDESGPIE